MRRLPPASRRDSAAALAAAAEHLSNSRKVIVLSGAGMSTAAGIPDFRSPGGLYGTSAALLERFTFLEDAAKPVGWQRAVLEDDVRSALTHSFFSVNPLPYHEMRRGLILGLGEGQWKLTLAHVLPEILNRKGKLLLLASQNIDGLDHRVMSDKSKLYNPHGLMSYLVSEPLDQPLCTSMEDPLYQRYLELVRAQTRDIYADRPARQGRSSHLWAAPPTSTPITLDQLADLLPPSGRLAALAERERSRGGYSVKPGTVLFDRTLWTVNAAGEPCSAFDAVDDADLVLVMGTSLSGLTIDHVAHGAGERGVARVVFDVGTAPVEALSRRWEPERDVHLQAPLDRSVLELCLALGWMTELASFLPYLCLRSLRALHAFAEEHAADGEATNADLLASVVDAIAHEVERERRFYGDESEE